MVKSLEKWDKMVIYIWKMSFTLLCVAVVTI